jgi:hypothetical protein
LAEISPEVMRGLQTVEKAAAKTGHLDARVHELIALAVASQHAATVVLPRR